MAPPSATITQSPLGGSTITGPSITSVVLSALFPNSQTANCTFQVSMLDTFPPTITCPPNQTQGYNSLCQFESYNYSGLVVATDNCNPIATISQTPAIGTIFPSPGVQTITVTATDNTGDSATCTFDITYVAPVPVLTQVGNQICTGGFATYQWFFNGVAIPLATDSCVTITLTGSYTVTVADSNGCSRMSGPVNLVGIDQGLTMAFTVSPVPARDYVTIDLKRANEQPCEVIVYNIAGKVVGHHVFDRLDAQTVLSLEGMAAGTYMLELRTAGLHGIKKLLVLH